MKRFLSVLAAALCVAATVVGVAPAEAVGSPTAVGAMSVCGDDPSGATSLKLEVYDEDEVWGSVLLRAGDTINYVVSHYKDIAANGNWSGYFRVYLRNTDQTAGTRIVSRALATGNSWPTTFQAGPAGTFTNTTGSSQNYVLRLEKLVAVSIDENEGARTEVELTVTNAAGETEPYCRYPNAEGHFGANDHDGYSADPVNTATGNLIESETDLAFGASVYGLSWGRFYNSGDTDTYGLGRGWVDVYGATVDEAATGTVGMVESDGRRIDFVPEAAGGYVRPEDFDGTLVKNVDDTWTAAMFDGTSTNFDAAGRVASVSSATGQTTTITRNAAGEITTAVSSLGPSLTMSYNAEGLISSVAASDGRTVSYAYTTTGFLESFTDVDGAVWLYTSDAEGRILTYTDPTGALVVGNTYDANGWVVTQTTGSGETSTFNYEWQAGVTTVTFAPSNEVVTYSHDVEGRLVAMTDALGKSTDTTRRADGEPVAVTTRDGETVTSTFDDNGNRLTVTVPGSGTTTSTFDAQNRMLTQTAPSGGVTTYTYSGTNRIPDTVTDALGGVTTNVIVDGLITSSTDPDGVVTSSTFDAQRRRISRTDGAGNTTTYTYDAAGRMLTSVTPLGNTTTYTYDAAGRMLTATSPTGGVSAYTYDAAGRILTVTDPIGGVTTNTYDAEGRIASATDARGNTTTYTFDDHDYLTSTVRPGGASWLSSYGELGRITDSTDPLGRTTTPTYDDAGRVVSVTDALGGVSTTGFGAGGRVDSVTDELGRVTSFSYDTAGRQTGTTTADGATTSIEYDLLDRPIQVTDARGAIITRTFTAAGRSATVTDASGAVTTTTYDAAGRVSGQTLADGSVVGFEYDADSRRTATVSPTGLRSEATYDAAGRMVTSTGTDGVSITYTYDAAGNQASVQREGEGAVSLVSDSLGLLSTTDPVGGIDSFTYDGRGNPIGVDDANSNQLTAGFDSADALVTQQDGLGRTMTSTVDGLGRVATVTDASGLSATLGYDAASQLTSATTGDGVQQSFTYDAIGRVTSVTEAGAATTYTYDAVGNLTSVVEPDGDTFTYEYDLRGLQTAMVSPDGARTEWTFDSRGRRTSLTDPAVGAVTYEWDADGRPTKTTFADGTTREWVWTGGQATTIKDRGDTWALSYDSSGRLAGATGPETWVFGYDQAGRLSHAEIAGRVTDYTFDAVGNITQVVDSVDGTTSFVFDAANQIVSQTTAAGVKAFVYDDAGRVVGESGPNGASVVYTYDSSGRSTQIVTTVPGGPAAGTLKAVDDRADTEVDEVETIDVLENDTNTYDADETLTITTAPSHGTAVVVVDVDGPMVDYTPASGFEGLDTFGYEICVGADCKSASVTIRVGDPDCTITGTNGPDTLNGTSGDDVICGRQGADVIDGKGGNDIIYGGKGADTIDGGGGSDEIHGGRGQDTIVGGNGNDRIWGGDGADTITGDGADDIISGGLGEDSIDGGGGADTIFGGRGSDMVEGGNGPDVIAGGRGQDDLRGGSGADEIGGGRGDDSIRGDAGDDTLTGGRGTDIVRGNGGTDSCVGETVETCETEPALAPAAAAGVDRTESFSYAPDGLLAEYTVVSGGVTQDWGFDWDRSSRIARLNSVDGPDGAERFVRGVGLEASTVDGLLRRNPLGDVGQTYGAYGAGNDVGTVTVGYRGELHLGEDVYLRARTLDTSSMRFRTVDLLAPSWGRAATSTYQYAYVNPVGFGDPSGLKPEDSSWTQAFPNPFSGICVTFLSDDCESAISQWTDGDICSYADRGCTPWKESHPMIFNGLVATAGVAFCVAVCPVILTAAGAATIAYPIFTFQGGTVVVTTGVVAIGGLLVPVAVSVGAAGVAAGINVVMTTGSSNPYGSTELAPDGSMLGSSGTETTSTTVGSSGPNSKIKWRIDVENPSPGGRPGQLHLQIGKEKYYYNFNTNTWEGAPRSLTKELLKDPSVQRAIDKGAAILGL